jgi:tol-pal system protein YbgF
MKLRALLFAGCCIAAAGSAHAGLLSDDEARKQVQQLEARISKLEQSQGRSLVDLQTQIDTLNAEMRKLRGQNQELVHDLQEAEKRQKDFYIDLDTRLRRFEAVDNAQPEAVSGVSAAGTLAQPAASGVAAAGTLAQQPAVPVYDPETEDRAYEAGYAFYRANSYQNAINAFQEFLKKFPDSVFVPNVHFWMGESYFAQQDYKNSLASYQLLVDKYSYSPKTPDAMLAVASCQQQLKSVKSAKKTLKRLIAKYPHSEAAGKAKALLKTLK